MYTFIHHLRPRRNMTKRERFYQAKCWEGNYKWSSVEGERGGGHGDWCRYTGALRASGFERLCGKDANWDTEWRAPKKSDKILKDQQESADISWWSKILFWPLPAHPQWWSLPGTNTQELHGHSQVIATRKGGVWPLLLRAPGQNFWAVESSPSIVNSP